MKKIGKKINGRASTLKTRGSTGHELFFVDGQGLVTNTIENKQFNVGL